MVDLCDTMEQVLQASSVMDLPLEMLAAVLCRVQQKDRLRICSLVCKLWRKAANLATSGRPYCQADRRRLSSLSMWLRNNQYASRISELFARNTSEEPPGAVLQLPADMLQNLQSLRLSRCTLEVMKEAGSTVTCTADLAPAAAITSSVGTTSESTTTAPQAPHQTSISALTALKSLNLDRTHSNLSGLGSCSGLQRLWLLDVEHHEPECSSRRAGQSSDVDVTPSTRALLATYAEATDAAVQAQGAAATDDGLLGVEVVTQTQNNCVICLPPQLSAALPQLTQLTSLGLHYSRRFRSNTQLKDPVSASLSSLQQLKESKLCIWDLKGLDLTLLPSNLTSLQVTGVPAVTARTMPGLQQLQQLKELRCSHCSEMDPVLLTSLTQLTCLDLVGTKFQSMITVQQLMAALQLLDKLKSLDLSYSFTEQAAGPEFYSALTASSELASLRILNCTLAPGAIDYIFSDNAGPKGLKTFGSDTGVFGTPGSFTRMFACCPALQCLDITETSMGRYARSLGDWQGFSTVTCLRDLTTLHLRKVEMPVDAISSIAACTQLQQLSFHLPAPWTPGSEVRRSITQLTQLTGLTVLRVTAGRNEYGFPLHYKLMFKKPKSADICQQLEEAIDSWRACR